MDNDSLPPITIFGVPLKWLLLLFIFIAVLLVSFDFQSSRSTIKGLISKMTSAVSNQDEEPKQDIVATPDMVENAIKEVIKAEADKIESKIVEDPNADYTYILELRNGNSLRAQDVTITPESVTFVSLGGLKTEIARQEVTQIRRIKKNQPGN